ncbi:hypothetical protein [Cohaesibacter sp. CAU 1516]|nr:hypothetical protein [Cohaesibacter sp. CAU 1516]
MSFFSMLVGKDVQHIDGSVESYVRNYMTNRGMERYLDMTWEYQGK